LCCGCRVGFIKGNNSSVCKYCLSKLEDRLKLEDDLELKKYGIDKLIEIQKEIVNMTNSNGKYSEMDLISKISHIRVRKRLESIQKMLLGGKDKS